MKMSGLILPVKEITSVENRAVCRKRLRSPDLTKNESGSLIEEEVEIKRRLVDQSIELIVLDRSQQEGCFGRRNKAEVEIKRLLIDQPIEPIVLEQSKHEEVAARGLRGHEEFLRRKNEAGGLSEEEVEVKRHLIDQTIKPVLLKPSQQEEVAIRRHEGFLRFFADAQRLLCRKRKWSSDEEEQEDVSESNYPRMAKTTLVVDTEQKKIDEEGKPKDEIPTVIIHGRYNKCKEDVLKMLRDIAQRRFNDERNAEKSVQRVGDRTAATKLNLITPVV